MHKYIKITTLLLLGLISVKQAWSDDGPVPADFLKVPMTRFEQTGNVSAGADTASWILRRDGSEDMFKEASQIKRIILSNEPDGGTTGADLEFDLNSVDYSSTPFTRLQMPNFGKLSVKRSGKKRTNAKNLIHVLVKSSPGKPAELVGSYCIKAGILTECNINITSAVNDVLARAEGKRILRLELCLAGEPGYYQVHGIPVIEGETTPILEIASPKGWDNDWDKRLKPLTEGPVVYREAFVPLTPDRDKEIIVKLLYPAKKIIEVIDNGSGQKLQKGRDWILRDGKLVFPANTEAPVQLESEFFTIRKKLKDGTTKVYRSTIKLTKGTDYWHHQRQMEVTYEPVERKWKFPAPISSLDNLPCLKKRFKDKAPVDIVLFGDSISEGYNASSFMGCWPYQSAYGELVAWKLRQHYDSKITFMNNSRAGARSDSSLLLTDSLVGWFHPDLCILAYGMNDRKPEYRVKHAASIEDIIDAVRKKSPETEFIIVTSMLNNPKQATGLEPILSIRDDALKIVRDGVAFVDVTTTQLQMLEYKNYLAFTGNGANHPNDFLHRIYAQRILEVLIP